MKRFFLAGALILGLVFMAWSQETDKTAEKENLKIKPRLYWSVITPLIIHDFSRFGLTVLSFDVSLLKYKNFRFLAAGVGLQAYQKRVLGWHRGYDYQGYPTEWYGKGYEFFLETYVKFIPIKYYLGRIHLLGPEYSEVDVCFELGITNKKDIVFGLTFSGNPFKKKQKNTDED